MEIKIKGEETKGKNRHNLRCPKTGRFVKAAKSPDFIVVATDAHRIGCQRSEWAENTEIPETKKKTNIKPVKKIDLIGNNTVNTSILLMLVIVSSLLKLFG